MGRRRFAGRGGLKMERDTMKERRRLWRFSWNCGLWGLPEVLLVVTVDWLLHLDGLAVGLQRGRVWVGVDGLGALRKLLKNIFFRKNVHFKN
ncbi:Uncharacterized protein TCM_036313 [Theobroma cacao]|uniref:Uncharacterized protein n=1 Tax=Theobroma cacao TaxID=3641 RepID=A0A061FJU9_THECC|nr:Uncharacterized protein TCM_036313 [Theobroma cacao]